MLPDVPVTTTEALAAGLSRGRLPGPAVRRLFPGVHLSSTCSLTLPLLVDGARKLLPPDALAAGVTALRLADVPVGPIRLLRFVTTHPHQIRRPDLLVTRTTDLPPADTCSVAVPHAFVTSATAVDLVELVAAGDRLVRFGRTTPAALLRAAQDFRGRGALVARRAAALVRERVDSPRETELRLCLVLAGLPEPEANVSLGTPLEPLARVDLLLRPYRLVLEYEGDHHRRDPWQWNRDIARQEALEAELWTVLRVTAEAMTRPRVLLGRVLRSLRAGGYAGPDPALSGEWAQLFGSTARYSRLAHGFDML